jgi:hypothetical protein
MAKQSIRFCVPRRYMQIFSFLKKEWTRGESTLNAGCFHSE